MTVENPSQITVDFRQNINNLVHFVKTEKAFSLMFFLVFIISLRNLFISLNGDEVTYNLIAENILKKAIIKGIIGITEVG